MDNSVKGKRVLITGAGSGIGASVARLFGSSGARVGLHYFGSEDHAKNIQQLICGKGGEAKTFQADFLDSASAGKLIHTFAEEFGGIDVLVNNAGGIFGYTNFLELDEASWDKTYSLNVKAPFFLMREAFSLMKAGGGRIINISSVSSKYGGSANNLHYSSSKSALEGLTRGFARAGAEHNILVNAIRCGVIDTKMREKIEGYSEERFKERVAKVLLKRAGTPEDVARMALFLASQGGDFITGEMFAVAGGD